MNIGSRITKWCVIIVIAGFVSLHASVSSAVTDQSIKDSMVVLARLSVMTDIVLSPLADVEDVSPECSLTNDAVEYLILNHAWRYYGGTSRSDLALALDELMSVMYAIADKHGNRDGMLGESERNTIAEIEKQSNGIRLLCCLYSAYKDIPH